MQSLLLLGIKNISEFVDGLPNVVPSSCWKTKYYYKCLAEKVEYWFAHPIEIFFFILCKMRSK